MAPENFGIFENSEQFEQFEKSEKFQNLENLKNFFKFDHKLNVSLEIIVACLSILLLYSDSIFKSPGPLGMIPFSGL